MEIFIKITAMINLIAMVCFLEIICCDIFKDIIAASSKDKELFTLVSIYLGTIEIND